MRFDWAIWGLFTLAVILPENMGQLIGKIMFYAEVQMFEMGLEYLTGGAHE